MCEWPRQGEEGADSKEVTKKGRERMQERQVGESMHRGSRVKRHWGRAHAGWPGTSPAQGSHVNNKGSLLLLAPGMFHLRAAVRLRSGPSLTPAVPCSRLAPLRSYAFGITLWELFLLGMLAAEGGATPTVKVVLKPPRKRLASSDGDADTGAGQGDGTAAALPTGQAATETENALTAWKAFLRLSATGVTTAATDPVVGGLVLGPSSSLPLAIGLGGSTAHVPSALAPVKEDEDVVVAAAAVASPLLPRSVNASVIAVGEATGEGGSSHAALPLPPCGTAGMNGIAAHVGGGGM